MKRSVYLLVFVASLFLSGNAYADGDVREADADMYPTDIRYDAAIPTPESFLGHALGSDPVRHHELVAYINHVAELSDRMSLEVIGYTHERRPILFLVVSSEENQARMDSIQAQHIALTEPGRQQAVTDDMPVITWINYGVHGAESSGMDAALPFVYYLAAAQGDEIERILSESVVLVTAIFNPDGHSKRVAWFDAYGGELAIADPAHIEHQYNWQFARTNHYWFDLNRQWLLLTQPEPRAWMQKWHAWRPNLTVDYHEMGSSQAYYFHPGVATRTNPLVPAEAERLMAETARSSEAFLDSDARMYFHGEGFDNYYVGKGSTFPLVNGGVGMLYEAGAALGREIETSYGLRTYRENIRKHFRTSIASIEAGVNLRLDYLRYQKSFYDSAIADAARYATKAWVFSAPGDPARMHLFADLLNYHRIATHKLTRDITLDGHTFRASEALIVSASQPQHRLIRSIFEAVQEFEDETFYDVSTWTLPPAFGLQFAALTGRAFQSSLIGAEYAPPMPVAATPVASNYGYAFTWNGYYAPRALQRILENDVLATTALNPFTASTSEGAVGFPRGSIIVPLDRQVKERTEILNIMRTIAADDGITVHSLVGGRSGIGASGKGIGGLGAPSFRALQQPTTLLVVGDDISLYDAGEIWHLLDYRMNMPVTLRDRDDLGGIEWERYTHIVFPSGQYDEYAPDFANRMRQWVAEGGTLIGLRDAAVWVRANTLDYVDPESEAGMAAGEAEAPVEEETEAPGRFPYAEKDDREAQVIVGGAIFSADLDVTHPLGFGYAAPDIFLHKNVKEPMLPTANPYATVIAYSSTPVFSGFVSEDNRDALAGTAALIAERSGQGSVILFADNPNFRGYWYGTNKLFLNSLFFSTVFDRQAKD